MTTTILARNLREGDTIDFGGQPWTVTTNPRRLHGEVVYVWGSFEEYEYLLGLRSDLPLNVQRPVPPDPDADVIEAITRELSRVECEAGLAIEWEKLTEGGGRALYQDQARAALAVVRHSDLLDAVEAPSEISSVVRCRCGWVLGWTGTSTRELDQRIADHVATCPQAAS